MRVGARNAVRKDRLLQSTIVSPDTQYLGKAMGRYIDERL